MRWTQEKVDFLTKHYPMFGVVRCAEIMGVTGPSIREKASRLGLRARGISEAWKEKQIAHSVKLSGRKRPGQALVMKALHEAGKLIRTPEQNARVGIRTKAWIEKNGHPKGALGMKHSDGTKAALGIKSKAAWDRMEPEKKQKRNRKIMETRVKNGTYAPERIKTTWKGGWREIGGIRKYYRSRWEANYARYLQWLKRLGEIGEWEHEPRVFWFDGIKRGVVSYLPDFLVRELNGKEAYHEVKGWMDGRSKTKIKRMAKYYPEIKLIVIREKEYKTIAKAVRSFIKDWE